MELVHVRLATGDLVRKGSVVITHASTGLRHALVVGDDVVLTDQDGEFHGGTVVSVGGDGHDPEYRLKVGARLPLDLAAQRMADVDLEPEHAEVHDVVDLLGDIRDLLRHLDRA